MRLPVPCTLVVCWPKLWPKLSLDERTQIIRIEEEGQKERCEQIVFHKETKVQDVINGLSMMKRDSAIIYESKGTFKICQNSDKVLLNEKIEYDFDWKSSYFSNISGLTRILIHWITNVINFLLIYLNIDVSIMDLVIWCSNFRIKKRIFTSFMELSYSRVKYSRDPLMYIKYSRVFWIFWANFEGLKLNFRKSHWSAKIKK